MRREEISPRERLARLLAAELQHLEFADRSGRTPDPHGLFLCGIDRRAGFNAFLSTISGDQRGASRSRT